jgi:Uncharacterized conserved protein
MVCIGVIKLEDYEAWIKSLGYDREWIVQATQSEVYRYITVESARLGMFSVPMTYDTYVVVANSAFTSINELAKALDSRIPVGFSVYLGFGDSYLDALSNLRPLDEHSGFSLGDITKVGEPTVVAHLDLDNYTRLARDRGFRYISGYIIEYIYGAKKACLMHGGFAHYAGGDNVICFIPREALVEYVNNAVGNGVKAGIGVARRPRDALTLAAQALDLIRAGGCGVKTCVLSDE